MSVARGPRVRAAKRGTACPRSLVALLGAVGLVGCDPGVDPEPAVRSSRFGVLRDLVWFDRGADGFFLDRFESTQADWRRYRAAVGASIESTERFLQQWIGDLRGPVDPAFPIVGLTLAEARDFARWRFCRLPRWDEWTFAATARGSYALPWGNLRRPAYANSADLGYHRLTPVGMFESARESSGPYDLIGNAGEWTESCVVDWGGYASPVDDDASEVAWRANVVVSHPALRVYWLSGCPLPSYPIVQVSAGTIPHEVTGSAGDPMPSSRRRDPVNRLLPTERASLVGVRVAAGPRDLLLALCAVHELPSEREIELLRQFLRRHRDVLAEVRLDRSTIADGPVAAIVFEELGD